MRRLLQRAILSVSLIGILGFLFLLPTSAEAQSGIMGHACALPSSTKGQCGTSASSCQNCHEAQAQDPVNAEGDWHIQHSFGDFCEFCHAGNVTATEKDAAHVAMIAPLSDPKGSCSTCHTSDYQELTGQYASTLGIELEAITQPTVSQPSESSATDEAPATEDASTIPDEESVAGETVDFNQRYDEYARTNTDEPINAGNMVLSVMLIGLVGTFSALAWKFEGLGDRLARLRGSNPQPIQSVKPVTGSPAIDALLPALEKANPTTLAALSRLLQADPSRGGDLIEALARLDPRLVEAIRRLSDRDLALLVALVRELKERS